MGIYTGNPSNGIVVTSTLPADGSKLMAADVNVSLELLLDNDAASAASLALKAPVASPTFTGTVSFPSAPLFPGLANHGALVSSGAFTVAKTFTVNAFVPSGPSGLTTTSLWSTPSQRFVIEGAIVQITGNCTASADPAGVELTLSMGGGTLVLGTMSAFAGGTSYTVNGSTANQTIFGLVAAERGSLFTPPLTNGGKDSTGAQLCDLDASLAVLTGASLWGVDVTLRIVHGAVLGKTLMIPFTVIIFGRLL